MKKIYVGNFSFSMTEPELRSLFEPYGAVESATLVTDRDTGRSRGFAFVEMSNDDEADKAMAALNGQSPEVGRSRSMRQGHRRSAADLEAGGAKTAAHVSVASRAGELDRVRQTPAKQRRPSL